MKFRVLHGHHSYTDKDGVLRMYRQGSIIETDTDLVAKFNREGSMKFERLDGTTNSLAAMSEEELRAFAASEEIDVSEAKDKYDVLRILECQEQTAPV